MVDGREKNGLYDLYEDVIAEMGLSVLSTRLPDSKKFRRDLSEERKSVFRSTIFPMDASLLKGSGIREFSEEISQYHQTSMSMGSRKVNTEGIDEELLIASIGRRKQDGTLYRAQEPPVPAPKEESVRKRNHRPRHPRQGRRCRKTPPAANGRRTTIPVCSSAATR